MSRPTATDRGARADQDDPAFGGTVDHSVAGAGFSFAAGGYVMSRPTATDRGARTDQDDPALGRAVAPARVLILPRVVL